MLKKPILLLCFCWLFQLGWTQADSNLLFTPTIRHSPISQVVRTIYQDSRGTFWIGAENGTYRLEKESLVRLEKVVSENGKGVTTKDITEAPDGSIWIGHSDGVSRIKGTEISNFYESDGLLDRDVWSIEADSQGTIWLGTIDGLCVYDGTHFSHFPLPKGPVDPTRGISSEDIVHQILEDRTGRIWISNNAGLFYYANDSLIHFSKTKEMDATYGCTLFEDKKGVLWISTKKGLFALKDEQLTEVSFGQIDLGKGIGAVAEDKDGQLWIVVNQHQLYQLKNEQLIRFEKVDDNKGPVVFEIFLDQAQRLWMVGFGGAFRLENGQFVEVGMNGPW